ncbi:MAG: class I SAM-dependent methyltransferase [Terracidiphilus sp.]
MTLLKSSIAQEPLQTKPTHPGPPSATEIRERLTAIAREYPPDLIAQEEADVTRISHNICLALRYAVPQPTICDVGGGVGLFSLGLSSLGYDTILIDDFGDDWYAAALTDGVLGLFKRHGVRVVSTDVIAKGVSLEPESLDVVSCFDAMEHFHHSPKRLFHHLVTALRPGGIFVLGVPNRVNLRKRIEVPFGGAPWTSLEDWYEPEVFRSHVREPDVPDLRYICRDLNLNVQEVVGRNWLGYNGKKRLTRVLTPFADHCLRRFPSLCSDIYIVGKKPPKQLSTP